MEGLIIKNISNDYVIRSGNGDYVCKARGKFRKVGISPFVGDKVIFDEKDCYILDILPRKNWLYRPCVSNVDQAIIVTAVKEPEFDSYLLDKLLLLISYYNVEPVICFTKLDLLDDNEKKEIQGIMDYYQKIGYRVITNEDIAVVRSVLESKVTVFTGQSGAGKSSLVNKIDSSFNLKTDEISLALGRGKHTTRHTELYEICDGYVVDTPGFSSLELRKMELVAIRDNMNEMFELVSFCKYRDCLHRKEDGCAVIGKYRDGEILDSRYKNYLSFLDECESNGRRY